MTDEETDTVILACIRLLQKEWYSQNCKDATANETPRDIGFRVGVKTGINIAIYKLEELRKSKWQQNAQKMKMNA